MLRAAINHMAWFIVSVNVALQCGKKMSLLQAMKSLFTGIAHRITDKHANWKREGRFLSALRTNYEPVLFVYWVCYNFLFILRKFMWHKIRSRFHTSTIVLVFIILFSGEMGRVRWVRWS